MFNLFLVLNILIIISLMFVLYTRKEYNKAEYFMMIVLVLYIICIIIQILR